MISNAILLVFNGLLSVILAPIQAINITINIISSIPIVQRFVQVIAYLLPMNNLKPMIFIIISLGILSIVLGILKALWDILPIL